MRKSESSSEKELMQILREQVHFFYEHDLKKIILSIHGGLKSEVQHPRV